MQKGNRGDWMEEAVQDMTEQGSDLGTELDSGTRAELDSDIETELGSDIETELGPNEGPELDPDKGTELGTELEIEPGSELDMLNPAEWEHAISMYGDMVYRVLRLHVKDKADADDLYQETFIRLMRNRKPFTDEEHRKAWLLRVTLNLCKDFHNSYWQRRMVSLSNSGDLYSEDETDVGVLQAVMKLPEKMRLAVHLHYYEGYTVPEMAQLLKRKENSIYSDLSRARIKLKKWLGG